MSLIPGIEIIELMRSKNISWDEAVGMYRWERQSDRHRCAGDNCVFVAELPENVRNYINVLKAEIQNLKKEISEVTALIDLLVLHSR